MTYDTVTVRRYDDSNMAGTAQHLQRGRNHEHHQSHTHGPGGTAHSMGIRPPRRTNPLTPFFYKLYVISKSALNIRRFSNGLFSVVSYSERLDDLKRGRPLTAC